MKDKLLWFGSLLMLTGLYGFTGIADDLRHPGELIGVGAILVFGITLIVLAIRARRLNQPVPGNPGVWIGAVLVLLGLVGFGFVADDLEHSVEIYISGAVLLAGIVLLVYSLLHRKLSPH